MLCFLLFLLEGLFQIFYSHLQIGTPDVHISALCVWQAHICILDRFVDGFEPPSPYFKPDHPSPDCNL